MRTAPVWILLSAMAGGTLISTNVARGQDRDAAAIHYADGVRAYFSGNSSRAEQSLSIALEMNSQDPRIYYFRALSLLRQGRGAEARGDMIVGAALEAQRPNRFAVGAALERVQGHDRLLLEKFRQQARSEASSNPAAASQSDPVAPSGTLRQRVVIPLESYLQPGEPQPTGRGSAVSPAPRTFAPTAPLPPTPGNRQPTPPEPATDRPGDPFVDDPQGATSAVPAPPSSTVEPPATTPVDGSDPFSDAATDSDGQNPFPM